MTVPEFLSAGTLLLRETTAVISESDLVSWIEKYEALVAALGPTAGASEDTHCSSEREVQRACWKISQDVLIRLRRLKAAHAGATSSGGESQSFGLNSAFQGRDVEVFRRRLFDIQTRWQSLRQTDPEVDNSDHNALAFHESYATLAVVDEEVKLDSFQQDAEGSRSSRSTGSDELLRQYILDNLSFKSMEHREQDVVKAHGDSFAWIFDEASREDSAASSPAFIKWLSTNALGSIYWITGKPGSGKSTLMRYLSEHRQTKRCLQAWASDKQVAIVGFYFWVSGSEDQRSRVGLLRSLLHQLLSLYPDLIPSAFPRLWAKLSQMTTKQRIAMGLEWTGPELTSGFLRLLEACLSRVNICLFIDGLDELDGDHESMIRFFRDIATGLHASQVKLCLSSRPWRVFERAFASSVPHLKLQELIRSDMNQYAHDSLRKRGFESLVNVGNVGSLVQEIVDRADGVFLWTRLVVGKITGQFRADTATVDDIQSYVTSFPSDLSQLFEKLVLEDQREEQLVNTSQLFQLVHAQEVAAAFVKNESSTSLSTWELAFALNADDDMVALTREVAEATGETIINRVREAISRVRQCSAGLLDIFPRRTLHASRAAQNDHPEAMARTFTGYIVTYLHRTVRDWLLYPPNNSIWQRLVMAGISTNTSFDQKSFDPHIRLLRSYVLRLKYPLEEIEHHRRLDEWYPDIALSLTHARYTVYDPAKLQKKLVDELDKVISWYWLTKTSRIQDHWALDRFGGYEKRGNLIIPYPFLALCTRFGLETYVLETLDEMAESKPTTAGKGSGSSSSSPHANDSVAEGQTVETEETPLLQRALEFLCSRQKTIYPLSSPSFVLGLLQYSKTYETHPTLGPLIGSPNSSFLSKIISVKKPTPWIMMLRHVRDAKRRGWIERFDIDSLGTDRWTKVVEMLILQGRADKDAVVARDTWDPETNAMGVLGRGRMLEEYGDWWAEDRLGRLFDKATSV